MTALDLGLVVQNAVKRDGQGRVALELAEALVRRGHRLTVYAHRVDDDLASRVSVRRLRRWPTQIVDDVALLLRASAAVRRAGHDAVCTLGPTAVSRAPTVFDVQFSNAGWAASWEPHTRPGRYHRLQVRVAAALERYCARRADRVISSTRRLAGELDPDARVPVSVVANGLDLDEFSVVAPRERETARRRFGLAPDAFAVGFLGDYHTPRKGLEVLLRAAARGPSDEVLLVAARGDDEALRARAAELGIAERTIAPGFAPPADVYAAADVVAVPSLYEPFSLVTLEAAARGVPVVVSEVAGAAELVGHHALQVRPDDDEDLRRALDEVRARPDVAHQRAGEARRIVEHLTWARLADEAAAVVERVARRDPHAGRLEVTDRAG